MPRHVWELQRADLLDAVVGSEGNWEFPKVEVQPSAKTGRGQDNDEGGKQRGQPESRGGRGPNGASLPGGLAWLLQEEHQFGAPRHRGPGVRAARHGLHPAGEAQLPQAVPRLRLQGGGEAHGGGGQLQLQVPLVLQGGLWGLLAGSQ